MRRGKTKTLVVDNKNRDSAGACARVAKTRSRLIWDRAV